MTKSLLCKLLQKQTYDILSHKYYLMLCFFGLLILLVSILHFGEVLLVWSSENYKSIFNFYTDNIMEKSYQDKLCQHLPIDVVYTWVNGSDPKLIEDLKRLKKDIEIELNISRSFKCPFSHCIESHMVILRPALPTLLTIDDLVEYDYIFNDARKLFTGNNPSGTEKHYANTIVTFDSREAAIICQRKKTLFIKNITYSIFPAYITSDWTAPNSIMLDDTIIMTSVPSQLTEEQFQQKLPNGIQQHIIKTFLYREKSIAVLIVSNKPSLDSVLQWESNFTIDNKSPSLTAANLVLYFTEETLNDDISASRFQDNEELRYSLRSIEKFAPWVHHIFIVTNGQIPYWLNLENPRISVVTHYDLYPNKSHLPTFSSPSIETHLHRIPGLSKKFLYMNDDVIFGKEIWPEDFYTHAKGHKVYLSWSVPECREGCPSSWINDGYCDKPCNNSDCQWDGGDCKDGIGGMVFNQNFNQNFQAWKDETEKMYCMPNCANTWIADRYCDQACNFYECGFDAGDCGLDNYYKLYSVDLFIDIRHYVLPSGITIAYFNLTSFLGENGSIADGSYEESPMIRVLAINQKFKVLTVILHNNLSESTIVLSIKGIRHNFEYMFQFNITADTRIKDKIVTDQNTTERAIHLEMKDVTQASTTHHPTTTKINATFKDFPEHLRSPNIIKKEINDSLKHSKLGYLNLNEVDLPLNISEKLIHLEELKNDGQLTDKGFRRKKAEIISDYLQLLLKTNNSLPNLVYELSSEKIDPKLENLSQNISNSFNQVTPGLKLNETTFSTNLKKARRLQGFIVDNSHNEYLMKKFNQRNTNETSEAGIFPWEKKGIYNSLQQKIETKEMYSTNTQRRRNLLDTFGDSLRHVNRLLNREFGYEARKVPAHMPHLVDVDIIKELQARFPEEFDITSSHKIRSTTDMQFAFSFFYFLMSKKEKFDISKIFDEFDTDYSGTWSDREIRTILTKIHDLPLTLEAVQQFEKIIMNCSQFLPQEDVSTPLFERYLNSKLSVVSKDLVTHCEPLMSLLEPKFSSRKEHKFEIVGEEEIAFKMIHTNVSQVIAQLDDIRKNSRKFICLNDNIDHHKEEAVMVKSVLIDFYESFFPIPSQFELPKEYRNRFLYMNELEEWQHYRNFIRMMTFSCLVVLIVIIFGTLFRNQILSLWRKIRPRRIIGRLPMTKSKTENV